MPAKIHVCKKCGCPLMRDAQFVLDDRNRQIAVEEKPVKAFGKCEDNLFYAVTVHMPHTPDRCLTHSAMVKVRNNVMQSSTIIKAVGAFLAKLKNSHSGKQIVDYVDVEELKKEIGLAVEQIETEMNHG